MSLTKRQQRELEYHRGRAKEYRHILAAPFAWDVIQNPGKRWWNAYWQLYAYFLTCDLRDKEVLVVGCGFGDDALRLSRLGANVSAFDLSPDSLQIAKELAVREGVHVNFREMPAERMQYSDSKFDYIVARDILHHVDISLTMNEIVRVAKPNARFIVDEIYSHSMTGKIRRSALVEKVVYPIMSRFIYGTDKPYITEDERKLSERDLELIKASLDPPEFIKYFNFIVTRLIPDRWVFCAKLDRILLRVLGPCGLLLAGRVFFCARVKK